MALLSIFPSNIRNRINFLYDTLVRNFSRSHVSSLIKFGNIEMDEGIPVPPPYLRWLVIHQINLGVFLHSGKLQATKLIEQLLKKNGYTLSEMTAVLDFGCGCGRIIRYFQKFETVEWWGSDYNPQLINWCQKNLGFAHFITNGLEPPIDFPDGKFEFIYARSVFTHLTEDQHHSWLNEIHRILQQKGLFLITVKGKDSQQWLNKSELEHFNAGKLVVRQEDHAGENVCSSFHPDIYLRNILDQHGFKIIDVVPGKTIKYMRQDAYLAQKV